MLIYFIYEWFLLGYTTLYQLFQPVLEQKQWILFLFSEWLHFLPSPLIPQTVQNRLYSMVFNFFTMLQILIQKCFNLKNLYFSNNFAIIKFSLGSLCHLIIDFFRHIVNMSFILLSTFTVLLNKYVTSSDHFILFYFTHWCNVTFIILM